MKVILGSRKHRCVAKTSIFLIMTVLIWAMMACNQVYPPEYKLTISSSVGGNVTEPVEGTSVHTRGKPVVLVVDPDEGYELVSWTGDVGNLRQVTSTEAIIRMKGDYSITARFEKIREYRLIVTATKGGSVTFPKKAVSTYNSGKKVDLKATAERGYGFVNWTGDVGTVDDVNAARTDIIMEGNYSIWANFEEESAVNITDPNLEAAIREAVAIPEDSIYPSDLDGLHDLDASGRNITDLEGLEYCTGLEKLYLSRNQISDISSVANLTRLEELSFGGNQINDILPLVNLSNLTLLNLSNNPIRDIQALVDSDWVSPGDKLYLYNYDALSYTRPGDSDVSTSIAELQEKGVIVEY